MLDPWFVDLEDDFDPRRVAEDAEGQDTYLDDGPGEEEDGAVDEEGWLSPEALGEMERAWSEAEYGDGELPF